MMNDPVISSAFAVLLLFFTLTAATLALLFAYIRRGGKRGKGFSSVETALALTVGGGVPVALLLYALLFSPAATLSPAQMHAEAAAAAQDGDDAKLLQIGQGLFRVHCAVCHGIDGNAPDGKGANLTHRISFESALLNIQRGANNFKRTFPGGMPPMIADTNRAAQVAHYVSSGFSENAEGEMLYGMLGCARCHGDEGRGREYLGPNIRAFDLKTVALVLKNGKNGVIGKMPRFDHFSDEQVRALGLYVISLGKQP